VGNFFTDVISNDPRFNSSSRINDIALLEPVTRVAVQNIIAAAAANGIVLEPFETYRSDMRQQLLYSQHATKLQTEGVHHFGLACDLVKVINRKPSWAGDFTFLIGLCKQYDMISGNDWGEPGIQHSFVDADHIQRVTLAQQPALFSGAWYPDTQ
jgi:hypothetical protein